MADGRLGKAGFRHFDRWKTNERSELFPAQVIGQGVIGGPGCRHSLEAISLESSPGPNEGWILCCPSPDRWGPIEGSTYFFQNNRFRLMKSRAQQEFALIHTQEKPGRLHLPALPMPEVHTDVRVKWPLVFREADVSMKARQRTTYGLRAAGQLRKRFRDFFAEMGHKQPGWRDQFAFATLPIGLEPGLVVMFRKVSQKPQALFGKMWPCHR